MSKLVENGIYLLKNGEEVQLSKVDGKFLYYKGYCEKDSEGVDHVGCRRIEVTENDIVKQLWRDRNGHDLEIGDIVVKLTEAYNSKVGHEIGRVVEISGRKPTVEFENHTIKVWSCDLLIITPEKFDKFYSFLNKHEN